MHTTGCRLGILTALLFVLAHCATADTFEVVQFRESRHNDAPAVDVRFSAPLAEDQAVNDLVALHHVEEGRVDGEWLIDATRTLLTFPFVQPNARYDIRVHHSLRAMDGRSIAYRYVGTIRTRRLKPIASFTSRGTVLSPSGAAALPISVVNVDKVDVNFFRQPPENVGQLLDAYVFAGTVNQYALARLPKIAEHVHTARFDVDPRPNQRTVANLKLRGIRALKQPGTYVAVMQAAGQFESTASVIYYTVSNIGLHARRYAGHLELYAHSLTRGKPMPGVNVELYDHKGNLLASRETDKDGQGTLRLGSNPRLLVARLRDQVTLLPIDRDPLDLSEFHNPTSRHTPVQVYAFGPRDLYRPG